MNAARPLQHNVPITQFGLRLKAINSISLILACIMLHGPRNLLVLGVESLGG